MTLRFIDGMDGYNTAQMSRKWSAFNASIAINATGGRRSSQSLRFANWDQSIRKELDNQSTWIVGMAFKCSALPSAIRAFIDIWDTIFTSQCSISINTDGTISAYRGNALSGGTLLGTSVATISAGIYTYIEAKFTVHNTTGSIEVRKDGVTILNLTGIDTTMSANNYGNVVYFFVFSGSQAVTVDMDDIYFCDTNGLNNNNFLGDLRVDVTFPTGVGNSSQFTPSTGNNWQNVDENPADDDVTYNSGNASGLKDTYAFPDIAPTVGTVFGVATNIMAKKSTSDTQSLRSVIRRGSTDYTGTTIALTTSYAMLSQIHEVDPSTALAWTIANVNAAEYGMEIV